MNIRRTISIITFFIIVSSVFIPTTTLALDEIKEIDNTIKEEEEIIQDDIKNKENKQENTTKDEKKTEDSSKNEDVEKEENDTNKNDNKLDENIEEKENIKKNTTDNNTTKIIEQELNSTTQPLMSTKDENIEAALSVSYRTHVQEEGWQEYVKDGQTSGTSGKGLRLEAINIQLSNNTSENINIKYQVHVQDIGWQDWKIDGEMAGTSGKSLRLEAIEIKIVKKQKKGMLCIETPTNESTYYNSETSNITVKGWKMANVSDTYIKAYVNDTQIDSETIKYDERPDIIKEITNYGTAIQNPIPGYEFNIDVSKLKDGFNTIKIDLFSDSTKLETKSITIKWDKNLHVQYNTHVQEEGWQDWKTDGEMAGTSGKGLRLEAMNIKLLNNQNENLNIKYQVHVQSEGWQDWKQNGELAGTSGKGLRLEAIKIYLDSSKDYSIMYRVHVQDEGWQDWKTDGEMAGTSGKSLRLEAIEIKIVEKKIKSRMCIETPTNGRTYYNLETSNITVTGWKMADVSDTYIKAYMDNKAIDSTSIKYNKRPDIIREITDYGTEIQNPTPGYSFNVDFSNLEGGNHTIKIEMWYKDKLLTTDSTTFYLDTNIHIKYSAHVEDIGWQEYVEDGAIIGTMGKELRIEALKIQLINAPSTVHIKYKSYVQGKWSDYVRDGQETGTTGKGLRLEAIQIEIEGAERYSVEYRSHVQNIGWQSWASNGMGSGTKDQWLRLEALQIRIVKTENTVVPKVKYSSHNALNGWMQYCENGVISGSTNNGTKLDAIKIGLENSSTAHIKYSVHVQNIGWLENVQDNDQAGTSSSANGIEAIKIESDGLSGYSIEYRVYIIGKGWQDWKYDGEVAGTTGQSLQISAIQIKIGIKTYVKKPNSSNFSTLDESKYPGFKQALQQLQSKYPNWTLKIVYTGLKWNDVLDAEERYSNGEPYSLTQETGNWRDSSDKNSYQGGWYKASRAAIAYMMDPRNSLDQYYVFQFQNLNTSSIENVENVSAMTNGTYLQNYCNTIVEASKSYNVSAFHLASRMILEQGTSGWSVNGYQYNGVTVYNYANIKATGKTDKDIAESGAAYAWSNKWFTPEFCINGTAKWIYDNYLSNGQNTKYFEKYNVVAQPFYTHQYMQNIRAANDEGKNTAKSLESRGLLDYPYEFLIPVYEDMPSSACPRPN